jgi:hypothetical protein
MAITNNIKSSIISDFGSDFGMDAFDSSLHGFLDCFIANHPW